MARTNPHYEWPDPASDAKRSTSAEWESLRNELVALLDHVEDQVANAHGGQPDPEQGKSAPPAPAPVQHTRHTEALRSVRQAVTRLADRNGEESVAAAVEQIRGRRNGAAFTLPPSVPAPLPNGEIADLAKSLDAMGERIASFETRIGDRLDTLGNDADISGQIAQLSDVIELLASAVGETGQIHRIEAQIGNLAEMLAEARAQDDSQTARRIEDLAATVEKLVTHQIDTANRDTEQAETAARQHTRSMETIEQSVRGIYERIDALETGQHAPDAQIEKLSHDMAALTEAVTASREPRSLLEKIDALSARIEEMEAPSQDEAEALAHSVSVLRGVIADTLEPRFTALEDRIGALDIAPAPAPIAEIEAQLRQISRRVEETSAQLKSLAESPEPAPEAPAPDFDALADLIVERTRQLPAAPQADADPVEKADLDALEERLAMLFARTGSGDTESAEQLAGVRSSIAQVDSRIARLEAMLNTPKPAPKPAYAPEAMAEDDAPVAATPARPRRRPDDAMPVDPASGDARPAAEPVTPEPAAAIAEPDTDLVDLPEEESEKPFTLDPSAIERPAKPQSSLVAERENPFAPAASDSTPSPLAAMAPSNATRASFIEAARRSARQPEPEDEGEPKSLIARALARFQRNEAEGTEPAPEIASAEPEPIADEITVDPFAEAPQAEGADEKAPGFFARNRRALLLGTALVAVIALAVPLVLGRLAPAPSTPAPAPQAEETAPAPAAEADEAADPLDALPAIEGEAPLAPEPAEANDLMSGVRIIEQQPSLSAARADAAALTNSPLIDPVQTASLPSAASSYAARDTGTETAASLTNAALPPAMAPEAIEPEDLRIAAEGGDRFAQFEIGAILTEGTLVEQDFEQAAAWYERSAAQGFVPAQYRLGSLYESGRGVARDLEMARLWYLRAAEAGNRMSMHNLASLYAGGELETQDFAAAAHWFEQAASRGLTDSQFNLGMLHARGLGVEQDFEQSYIWFSLAARSGDEDAAGARDDVARSLSADIVQRLNETIDGWSPDRIDLAANFAPIGTWDETFDPGPAVTNSDVILRVQMLLGKLGYDVGRPDGIAGPRTREAIAAFERETGMSESGAINPRLLAVLGSQPV